MLIDYIMPDEHKQEARQEQSPREDPTERMKKAFEKAKGDSVWQT